jgi:hypothetical protein
MKAISTLYGNSPKKNLQFSPKRHFLSLQSLSQIKISQFILYTRMMIRPNEIPLTKKERKKKQKRLKHNRKISLNPRHINSAYMYEVSDGEGG